MDKPGVLINVDEAVVRTATIEIRMLMIDRRKVTLSLFRQFKQRDFLDRETGAPNGVAWGLVNYFWPGCDNRGDPETRHLHVLWQDGQELYRDCVYAKREGAYEYLWGRAHEYRTQAWYLALLAVHTGPGEFWMEPEADGRYLVTCKRSRERRWVLSKEQTLGYLKVPLIDVGPLCWETNYARYHYADNYAIQQLHQKLNQDYKDMSAPEIWTESFDVADRAQDYDERATNLRQRWKKEFQLLTQLEQLFIAG